MVTGAGVLCRGASVTGLTCSCLYLCNADTRLRHCHNCHAGIVRGLPDKSKYEHQRRLDTANNVLLLSKIWARVCLVTLSESLGHTRHDHHSALALAGDQVRACTALEDIHHNLHLWPNLKYFVSSPQMWTIHYIILKHVSFYTLSNCRALSIYCLMN